ncbi:hypothetical protein [Labrenzia sp. 011]|uniref:hypothetical protein n=1 Tax=Labrenzia sp. 011 TaxID=2171494 RepID=UPI000D516F7B|nr:hypothetical protein [Labrenzia sp. 011]PVB62168.1 hypothetical protein DCO57_07635 [Labrenzia sp. 011]
MRPLAEFAIVFGASLLLLFVIVPAGTVETDNFGLSPRMLPMVCVTVIALMSLVTLLFGLMRPGPGDAAPRAGLRGVIQLGAAALAGVILVDLTGLVIGGTALVLLASLAVGERRLSTLAGTGAGGLLILLLVDWSGL